jgi:hypothetical protein
MFPFWPFLHILPWTLGLDKNLPKVAHPFLNRKSTQLIIEIINLTSKSSLHTKTFSASRAQMSDDFVANHKSIFGHPQIVSLNNDEIEV